MDPVLIIVAFAFGFLARRVGLPAMLGFIAAGFLLFQFGFESTEGLEWLAKAGIWLLLFSIGLKLNVRNLLQPVVWAGTTIYMAVTTAVLGVALFSLGLIGFASFSGLTAPVLLLIAFALSFSSTIFAVKIQEEKAR